MSNNRYIIDKVLVEIETSEIKKANTLKNNIRLFLEEELFPKIESMFNEFDDNEKIVRLDKVSVNLSIAVKDDQIQIASNFSEFQDRLKTQVVDKTFKIDRTSDIESQNVNEISRLENLEEIWLFYLENGYHPWYANKLQVRSFVEEGVWQTSFEKKEFTNRFIKILKDKRVFQRFVYQYPISFVYDILLKVKISEIVTHIQGNNEFLNSPLRTNFLYTLFILSVEKNEEIIHKQLTDWVKQLYSDGTTLGVTLNRLILKSLPKSVLNSHSIQLNLNRMLDYSSVNNLTKNEDDKRGKDTLFDETTEADRAEFFEKDLNTILVQNAGLIIIHPFLKHLFSSLAFLDKENQILPVKKFQAVQLLHFISTGEEEFWEGDMVFEKFLCGVPLNSPVPKESLLTKAFKQEAEHLLIEVIKRWPELKNTSPDGLRQMFFQREGKLIKRERNYKLIVERKAQDVLLDNLAWNISLVKIPWMKKELLHVQW